MKVIKEPKNVELLINIICEKKGEKLIQHFKFNVKNKKHLDYLFDNRFLFKQKIDKIISANVLDGFIERVDDVDEVRIKYINDEEIPKPFIRKINVVMPPFFGCEYCCRAEKKDCFIYCKEKGKHYTKGILRCPIFKCKEIELT